MKRRYLKSLQSKSGDITKQLSSLTIKDDRELYFNMLIMNQRMKKIILRNDYYTTREDEKIIFE